MRPAWEEKWQRLWEKHDVYRVADPKEVKKEHAAYALEMFPYPSAEGLHVGHPEGYTASDIYARYLRMNGKSVLHPMGFDSFGLPAENYAIKTGTHPAITTKENIENMRRQIRSFGFSYDWDREVITSDPQYYKWTQWIFLKLFEAGLAYEAEAPINWCPKDKTGLANEEVVGGKCERCGTQVEKKNIRQWLVKITDERYIERLLHGHDNLDWPESLKLLQRNWIGRSEGAEVTFDIPLGNRIVFMHSKHAKAGDGWYPAFYEQAKIKGYEVVAHDLPNTDEPEILEWLAELDKAKPDEATILVGHSRGCSAILRWLEKQPKACKVAKVILVAPSLGDSKLSSKGFYGKSYNYKKIIQHCNAFTVIHSVSDPIVSYASGVKNAKGLRAKLITVEHRGHFDSKNPLIQLYPELHAEVTVFTTRPDTLFGATYMVLSPEHPLLATITTNKQKKAVEEYQKDAKKKSDLERTDLAKEKTGVFTGSYAINPVNGEKIPVWIADYVLATYGTGAIMAVPAHDERDFAFAKKYRLKIVEVIASPEKKDAAYSGEGKMKNSGRFNNMSSQECRKQIIEWLQGNGNQPQTCLVVHGISGHKRENWFPWLKQILGTRGWNAIVPTLPGAGHPTLQSWNDFLHQYDQSIDERSVLVGHSLGCASILYYLQESGKKVDTVIFVAPTNPLQKWDQLKRQYPQADWDAVRKMNSMQHGKWPKIRKSAKRFIILHSDNDPYIPSESMAYFKENLPEAEIYCITGKSHFSESTGGITSLPEILPFFPLTPASVAMGKKAVNYKLRDWVFSRQRYWGEPIPIVHCEHCKKEAEATSHYLNFYHQPIWDRLMSGEKTIESRVLNPEEPERYFGKIRKGEVIKFINKNTSDIAYFKVTEIWKFKNAKELFKHQDIIASIKGKAFGSAKELLASYESLAPGYAEKLKKNGLVCWKIQRVFPGLIPVPEKDLPIVLPDIKKFEPTGTGESPLASIKSWVNTKCPNCKKPAKRETNTMPQWAGSNWYFMRYCDPHNDKKLADPKKLAAWLPVDVYTGGAEHAVLHFLYARFIYKFLFDIGVVPKECGDEPFIRVKNQGLIMGEDGQKMSKSRGNVINPDAIVKEFGADVMRMYEMFMGPFEDAKPWDTKGMIGIKRFLDRVQELPKKISSKISAQLSEAGALQKQQQIIMQISKDIEQFHFNTAISSLMVYSNYLREKQELTKIEVQTLLVLLSPFAPHIAEELWQTIHERTEKDFSVENSIVTQPWPTFDESKTKSSTFILVVMINGKKRADFSMPADATDAAIKEAVHKSEKVQTWITGKKIQKEMYIKGRIYSIVVT